MRNIGSSSVLMTELWGIYTALTMVWGMNFHKLWIESDSLVAVTLIGKDCQSNHPHAPMIIAIKELLSRPWQVKLTRVLREGNFVADSLANLAHSSDLGVHWLEGPPYECRHY